jgi:hypothetical protein
MRSIDSGEWVEGIKETGRVLCEVFSINLIFPHSPLKVRIIRLLRLFAIKSKSPIRRRVNAQH